jgi:hypothetical protein
MASTGQVELSPLLFIIPSPPLCDTDIARIAMPKVNLPGRDSLILKMR